MDFILFFYLIIFKVYLLYIWSNLVVFYKFYFCDFTLGWNSVRLCCSEPVRTLFDVLSYIWAKSIVRLTIGPFERELQNQISSATHHVKCPDGAISQI